VRAVIAEAKTVGLSEIRRSGDNVEALGPCEALEADSDCLANNAASAITPDQIIATMGDNLAALVTHIAFYMVGGLANLDDLYRSVQRKLRMAPCGVEYGVNSLMLF
jgi:hypothetical protein